MTNRNSQSVCVFCGSRLGVSKEFLELAKELGGKLALNDFKLVYGGGGTGLMGVLAQACEDGGGSILGVMPSTLAKKEFGKKSITNYVITDDMHERKKLMYMNSNAIIAMPGGIGTLEELFEMITWKQLGYHSKPVYLLDTFNFWENTIKVFDHIIEMGFVEPIIKTYFKVCKSVDEVFEDLRTSNLKISKE